MESPEASPDVLLGLAVASLCCFAVSSLGFVGVLIWYFRARGRAPAPLHTAPPSIPAPASPAGAPFHLSVLAVSFDGFFKAQLEQALAQPSTAVDALGAQVELVQRAVRGVNQLRPQWRHFGYGEKDFATLEDAQQGFVRASDDFRLRTQHAGDGGALVVLTLVTLTRGARSGVSRLDSPDQVQALLADRAQLDGASLLSADLIWAPPASPRFTDGAVRALYPEMHAFQ